MTKRKGWADFVGLDVHIKWRNPDHDWPYYHVISCNGDSALLGGIDFPDGSARHDGGSFRGLWRSVKTIKAIEKQSEPSDAYFQMENGVLDRAKKTVDERDRQSRYGPPEEFMGRLAKMWGGYLGIEVKPTDAAMMMALLKAARLKTSPDHEDSLVDFAGYAHIYERVK